MGSWTGSGPILTGTCSTAAWTLFDLSTAYLWAPVIGCVEDKIDCCPSSFAFAATTTTTAPASSVSSTTTSISSSGGLPGTLTTSRTVRETSRNDPIISAVTDTLDQPLDGWLTIYPRRAVANYNGVARCPEDYVTVGATGCCPFGMSATQTPGLSAACASKLSTPFPVPEPSKKGLPSAKPISTATDVIYALQYHIYNIEYQPPKSDPNNGLSTGVKAGIGAGCGVLALILLGVVVNFIRRRRQKRKQEAPTTPGTGMTEEKTMGNGPAELGAADVKQTYELSNSQIKSVSSPPVMPGTPTYELSGTPNPENSATPRPRPVVTNQQNYLGKSSSGQVLPQIDEHQAHGATAHPFLTDATNNQGYHHRQPAVYTGQPAQHYQT